MITEEWEKGPENVKGEAARWWKISLQTLINNSEEDKNLWLQSSRAAKKKHKRNHKTRQQMMTKWIRKRKQKMRRKKKELCSKLQQETHGRKDRNKFEI